MINNKREHLKLYNKYEYIKLYNKHEQLKLYHSPKLNTSYFAVGNQIVSYHTSHSICRFRFCHLLGFMVPQLLLIRTGDLWHDELNILRYQFTLLPGDRLAFIVACPDLVAISIRLPKRNTILFCHVFALGKELLMGDCLLPCCTGFLNKKLRLQLTFREFLILCSHRAICVRCNLK